MSQSLLRRWLHWVAVLLVTLLLTAALLINIVRFASPLLNHYQGFFERFAAQVLHQPVKIGQISIQWQNFEPELQFDQVVIERRDGDKPLANIQHLNIGINIWHSVRSGSLQSTHVVLAGVKLNLYQNKQGEFLIENKSSTKGQSVPIPWDWLLEQADVTLKDLSIAWHHNGRIWPIRDVTLQVINANQHHYASLQADLPSQTLKHPGHIHAVVKFQRLASAQLYVKADSVALAPWQWLVSRIAKSTISTMPVMHGGYFSGELWAKWAKGAFDNAELLGTLRDVKLGHGNVINQLSGRLHWQQHADGRNKINIQSDGGELLLPELFTHTVSFKKCRLGLAWQRGQTKKNKATVATLLLSDRWATIKLHGTVGFLKSNTPRIALSGAFSLSDLGQIKQYLPNNLLSPDLYVWLTRAFVKGHIKQGHIHFRKKTNQSPVFQVTVPLADLRLHYSDAWPDIEHGQGVVSFVGQKMQVKLNQCRIGHITMTNLTAVIPDLMHPVLTVNGAAQSNLLQAQQFLKHSPLPVADSIDQVDVSGKMGLALQLKMPLSGQRVYQTDVQGAVTFSHSAIKFPAWGIILSDVNGDLLFHDKHFSAKHIHGLLWGQPIAIDLSMLKNDFLINLGGHWQLDKMLKFKPKLRRALRQSIWAGDMAGGFDYRALLTWHRGQPSDKHSSVEVNIMSDWRGLDLKGLPPPFAKTKKQAVPSQINLMIQPGQPIKATVQYGERASLAATLSRKDNNEWQLVNADLHFGSGQARLPHSSGIFIDGTLMHWDWSNWRTFIADSSSKRDTAVLDFSIDGVAVHTIELQIQAFQALGYRLSGVYFKVMAKPGHYLVNIQNDKLAGIVTIPRDSGHNSDRSWKINLAVLTLPERVIKDAINPKNLPPLDITIKHCQYGSKKLGYFHLVTTPDDKGVVINNFILKDKNFHFTASGWWHKSGDREVTHLRGGLQAQNLGKLLQRWKLSPLLEGGRAGIGFDVSWQGVPYDFQLATLDGQVNLWIEGGRILQLASHVDGKLGLGRILNLLSLQSLPETILSGFTSVLHKGFSFDQLKGDFNFTQGVAHTAHAYVDGSVADVSIHGDIGFSHQYYNLWMSVEPHLTASAPLIAGLAGGPIAGVATWLANQVVDPVIGKLAQSNYRITGTWQHPSVVKLQEQD